MAPANARCGGPPPPDGGNETAGRAPKVAIRPTVLPCDCCPRRRGKSIYSSCGADGPCSIALHIPVSAMLWVLW